MKQRHLLLVLFALLSMVQARADVVINATNFPDEEFRKFLERFADWDHERYDVITDETIAHVKEILIYGGPYEADIHSLKGIEFFTELERLDCVNHQLTELDISKNTALKYFSCAYNQLTTLDVSKNTALEYMNCMGNLLTTIDISKNTALKGFTCDRNQLTALEISKNAGLEELSCSYNLLSVLDVSKNTALTYLHCDYNQLTALDLSKNTALNELHCNNNQLTSLDVSGCTALNDLRCYDNQLTALDVSGCTALDWLYCYSNQLTALDVSGCTALVWLSCYNNQIKGAAMDALISSLRVYSDANSDDSRLFYAITTETFEGNVITTTQVKAFKAKKWIPYIGVPYIYEGTTYYDWQEYAGSDDLPGGGGGDNPGGGGDNPGGGGDNPGGGGDNPGGGGDNPGESGGSTNIQEVTNDKNSNDIYFDLSGRRVMTPQKGVYVKNGKKVVVK